MNRFESSILEGKYMCKQIKRAERIVRIQQSKEYVD